MAVIDFESIAERMIAKGTLAKAKGIPSGPGSSPPGPPPRPGLQWDSGSHRWVRAEEVKKPVASATSSKSTKQ